MKSYRITSRLRFTIFLVLVLSLIVAFCASFTSANVANGQDIGGQQIVTVEVTSGQTLWDIASEYADSRTDIRKEIYRIKKLNNMETSDLQVGQTLIIPID